MLKKFHQSCKKLWLQSLGIIPTLKVEVVSPNPGEQAWPLCPSLLVQRPMVFSLGLAKDLSFDLGMIQKYQAEVHGFDPTDDCRNYIATSRLPADFHYHCLAVAGHDGTLDLFERLDKGGKRRGASFQSAPCRRYSTLVRELKIEQVDLLKIDIEGTEYEVLEDVLSTTVLPKQIAVEFHHRFREVGIRQTVKAHRSLERAGYQLAYITDWAEEFLYLKVIGK